MTFRTCADVSLSPRARKSPRRKKKNFKHLVLLFLFNGRSFFPLGSLTVVVVVLILFFFLFIEAHTLRSRSIFRCALAHQFNDLGVVPSSYGFLLATEFFRCVIYRLPLHLKVKKDSRKLFRRKQIPGRDDTILCVCVCACLLRDRDLIGCTIDLPSSHFIFHLLPQHSNTTRRRQNTTTTTRATQNVIQE